MAHCSRRCSPSIASMRAMRSPSEEASRPVRADQAGRCERSGRGRDHRGMGRDAGHGRRADHDGPEISERSRRSRPEPDAGGRRPARPAGQHPVLGTAAAGRGACRAQPRHSDRGRPCRHDSSLRPAARPQPFDDLPNVLALAQHENLAIKITGACTYSHEAFPYATSGIRWPACSMPSASTVACGAPTGPVRSALLTYKQGVDAFRVTDRLSDSDRATLMGGSLQQIYGWSPTK